MKRETLLRHLRKHGCFLKREGSEHSRWASPVSGATEAVPRHIEVPDKLVRKVCRRPGVPDIKLP